MTLIVSAEEIREILVRALSERLGLSVKVSLEYDKDEMPEEAIYATCTVEGVDNGR